MKAILIKLGLFTLLTSYVLLQTFDARNISNQLAILIVFLTLHILKNNTLKYIVVFMYLFVCIFYSDLVYGLMLIPFGGMSLWVLVPFLLVIFLKTKLETALILGVLTILTTLVVHYMNKSDILMGTTQKLEDSIVAHAHHAESEQERLLSLRQHDLEVSVLNERNRIARDIHDNVGHLLTSAILQVGAMRSKASDPSLNTLKETLDQGMNAIRKSVHALYNESFLLNQEIENILDEYSQLKVEYNYKIVNDPSKIIKVTFASLVKESMNNVIKHSNATDVVVQFDESQHHYYCLIHDNGSSLITKTNHSGIGLLSLEKRVKDVNGIINIQYDNGFRIYVSIPKEAK